MLFRPLVSAVLLLLLSCSGAGGDPDAAALDAAPADTGSTDLTTDLSLSDFAVDPPDTGATDAVATESGPSDAGIADPPPTDATASDTAVTPDVAVLTDAAILPDITVLTDAAILPDITVPADTGHVQDTADVQDAADVQDTANGPDAADAPDLAGIPDTAVADDTTTESTQPDVAEDLPVVCAAGTCGESCAICEKWQECEKGVCAQAYPPPPYGPHVGEILPDMEFVDPETGQAARFRQFYGDGKLLLITFSAGWCIVCGDDTQLFNAWHTVWSSAGLRIVEVLYETSSKKPPTESYGNFWKSIYGIVYPLWIDTPYLSEGGKAAGGNLPFFQWTQGGPTKPGTFPVTLLVCPQTMEILYITEGFKKEIVEPLVIQYLIAGSCN
jgi:hypothetical protein